MAFDELKARQSVAWGNGPYQRITETIRDIHERVVERVPPREDVRWLDVACGTGAVAERAAAGGATVTGVDLAPALVDTARERAAQLGLEIEYVVGDCESLDAPDGNYDVVSSTCGVMFSPDHDATASELARVTSRGARIALANWTPNGGVSDLFRIMSPFLPGPPPSNPFDWGVADNVERLLGESFELELETHVSTLTLESGEEYWELFSSSYGPTKTLAESLGERREELRQAWVEFFEENHHVNGSVVHEREYLLILGTRR